jgi:hypothetical protein
MFNWQSMQYSEKRWRKPRELLQLLTGRARVAQFSLHAPVNELHLIETKADANSFFLLTQNLEGVKT